MFVFGGEACAIQPEVRYFRTSNRIFPGSFVSRPLVKGNEDPGYEGVVQIFQDGGRPQVISARIREIIRILQTIQVTMDRVMMRSVIRSVIDSNGFQRNRFGGHALEQIAFEPCSPPVELELRVFGS